MSNAPGCPFQGHPDCAVVETATTVIPTHGPPPPPPLEPSGAAAGSAPPNTLTDHPWSTPSIPPSTDLVPSMDSTKSPIPVSSAIPAPVTASAASSSVNGGAIAGGVVGGILALVLLALAGWFLYKRRKRERLAPSTEFMRDNAPLMREMTVSPLPPPYTGTHLPFPLQEKMPV